MLEKGEMKKDYNANTTGADSEDEDDPRTPTSVSSQGSQGYDSAGSDFVDIEGFSQITPLPDSSLPEISLQVSITLFKSIKFESSYFLYIMAILEVRTVLET